MQVCQNLYCKKLFYVQPSRVGRKKYCCKFCNIQFAYHPIYNFKRFWDNVEIKEKEECWEWKCGKHKFGYGKFSFFSESGKRITISASVFAYTYPFQLKGKSIGTQGMWVLHTCDNPPCCNPKHLYAGTPQDNVDDAISRNRKCIGQNSPLSKLEEWQIKYIRFWYTRKGKSMSWIAKRYNISKGHVFSIANYKCWKHLP